VKYCELTQDGKLCFTGMTKDEAMSHFRSILKARRMQEAIERCVLRRVSVNPWKWVVKDWRAACGHASP